jgi:hypothetical protein
MKIEGRYYPHDKKEDLDLSDVRIVRFNFGGEDYIDVSMRNGQLEVNGSQAIKITLSSGCNHINVSMNKD